MSVSGVFSGVVMPLLKSMRITRDRSQEGSCVEKSRSCSGHFYEEQSVAVVTCYVVNNRKAESFPVPAICDYTALKGRQIVNVVLLSGLNLIF